MPQKQISKLSVLIKKAVLSARIGSGCVHKRLPAIFINGVTILDLFFLRTGLLNAFIYAIVPEFERSFGAMIGLPEANRNSLRNCF
jgi:hypothetical protein